MKRPVNWNSLLLVAGFGILGFLGKEMYSEVRQTHDIVIDLKARMVPREEFEVELNALKLRIVAVELDMQRLKSEKPN